MNRERNVSNAVSKGNAAWTTDRAGKRRNGLYSLFCSLYSLWHCTPLLCFYLVKLCSCKRISNFSKSYLSDLELRLDGSCSKVAYSLVFFMTQLVCQIFSAVALKPQIYNRIRSVASNKSSNWDFKIRSLLDQQVFLRFWFLQRMHDSNLCPSRPTSLPPAPQLRRFHSATTRHPWEISTHLQRQRRQKSPVANGQPHELQ